MPDERLNVGSPRYRESSNAIDSVSTPFFFPADLHPYIYGGISSPGNRPGLIRHQAQWEGAFYSYYQENSRRYLFYYIPDAFKVVRRAESPHWPSMSVKFTSEDGSVEKAEATLSYAAVPYVDPDRLRAAAAVLKGHVGGTLPPGVSGPVFQPLLADAERLRFRLALPGAAGTTGPFRLRPDAQVNVKLGIVDSLPLSRPELHAVYDAVMAEGRGAALMTGEVEISLGETADLVAEKVPFIARMNDLAGEIFDYHREPAPEAGAVGVWLRNAIESPVRVDRLAAVLRRNEAEVPGELRGLTLPIERLAPGAELAFVVAPTALLPGEGLAEVVFDLDGVTVLPDREAIWAAIQDSYTAQYQQVITVKTPPAIFAPPAGQPEEQRLLEIDVELRRGEERAQTVALTPEKPEVQATLGFPIADTILGRPNSGEYRYQVTAVRLTGRTTKEWKTHTGDRLFVLQPDIA